MKYFLAVLILASVVYTECSAGLQEIVYKRTFKSYATEESFDIYPGTATSGTPVYSWDNVNVVNTDVTRTNCMPAGMYTLVLRDVQNDGWYLGAFLKINAGPTDLGIFRVDAGKSPKTYEMFVPTIVPYGSTWKYTSTAQTSTSWTTASNSWTESASFPAVSTITRYFRKTYSLDNYISYFNMEVNVKCRGGFILYLNGIPAYTFNMPTGTITSSTAAIDSTSGDVVRTFSSLRGLYFSSKDMEIGIEVHSTSSTTSGAEWFNAEIIFNGGQVIRRIGTSYTANASHNLEGGEGVGMLYDGRADTKWCFTHTQGTPVWASIQFTNGRREVVNNYRIATANDMQTRDPTQWVIKASNDGSNWVTLDTQTGISWGGIRFLYQTFRFQNYIAYNYYRFEGGYKVSTDSYYQFSEFDLYLENVPVATPGIAYPQTTYTFYTNEGNMDLVPIMGGYINWQISPTSLPSGISFNSLTGAITGVATTTQAATTYTVSATYLVDSKAYTTQLSLSFEACALPLRTFVTFTKDNAATTTETFAVYKGSDKLYEFNGGATTESVTKRLCLTFEMYTVKMVSTVGSTWTESSLLTITSDLQTPAMVLAKIRLTENEVSTFNLNYGMPILPVAHNSGVKYRTDGTIDENWYTKEFTADSWTSLTGTGTRPTTTHKITLYRVTFSVTTAQITACSGYELKFANMAGVVAYLNGVEITRLNVGEGAVTSATEALAGGSTVVTRTLTGKAGHLVNGQNVLAVALIQLSTSGAAGNVFGDFVMRLLADTQTYTRYWDHSSSGNVGSTTELFDNKLSTRYYQSRTSKPQHVFTLSFGNNRQEYYNKYCIVTNWDGQPSDPRDWMISGADTTDGPFTELKSEANVVFDDRSKSYCFYMPLVSRAYQVYRFNITETNVPTSTYLGIGMINLYLENLDSIVVPDLAFEPSTMTVYTGAAFTGSLANSPYYSSFTITPTLPAGLSINAFNGAINGVPTQESSQTTYTVSAKNHLGESKSAQVSLTVIRCADDKTSFSLEFITESYGKQCGFELINKSSKEVVTKRDQLADYSRIFLPMCESATLYTLRLKKTDSSGWGANHVIIRLADNTVLLMESLAGGTNSKDYDFNVNYSVAPQFSTWRYYMENNAPNDKWKSDASVSASWKTSSPTHFPAATTVTQYYVKTFTITSMDVYASMDLSFMVQAGGIMYINGHEVNRINLPSAAITHTTASTSSNENALKYTVGFFVQESVLRAGENILAVELHRYIQNEAKNTFDASCILILDNMYMIMDGIGTSEPKVSGQEGTDKAFDNNSSTKMVRNDGCVDTELIWSYSGFRKEVITNYGLVSASDCNQRHPSGWELFGSNNNKDWLSLSVKTDQVFSSYKQQIRHSFFNVRAFNQYKLKITECANKAIETSTTCGTNKFQLADFYLFTKRLEGYCKADGDFPPALNGDYSHANCPLYMAGSRKRLCSENVLGPVEENCKPGDPEGLKYTDSPDGVIKLNVGVKVDIKPEVYAVEYQCFVSPKMPEGLTMVKETCAITGEPVIEQIRREYQVRLGNVASTLIQKIYIEIGPKPAPILLIIIIVVVVVLLIVGIVLWIMMSKKNGGGAASKKAPKKAAVKKGGASKTAATPAAQKKAEVKV